MNGAMLFSYHGVSGLIRTISKITLQILRVYTVHSEKQCLYSKPLTQKIYSVENKEPVINIRDWIFTDSVINKKDILSPHRQIYITSYKICRYHVKCSEGLSNRIKLNAPYFRMQFLLLMLFLAEVLITSKLFFMSSLVQQSKVY